MHIPPQKILTSLVHKTKARFLDFGSRLEKIILKNKEKKERENENEIQGGQRE
jgi:hypothetical protein